MKKTKAPVVHAESYQKLLDARDRMKAIEGIRLGLESMKRGAGVSAEKFFQEFFREREIPQDEGTVDVVTKKSAGVIAFPR